MLAVLVQSVHGQDRSRLRVGYVPILNQLPLVVSYEIDRLGFGKNRLRLVKYNSFTSLEAALRAKALDIAAIPVPIALRLAADGEKIKIIGTCHAGGSLLVSRQAGGLDTLRGKRIGVPGLDSNENFSLRQILGATGLRPGLDYRAIAVPFRIAIADLQAGRLDAFFLPEPFGTMGQENAAAFAIEGQDKLAQGLPTVLVVRAKILNKSAPLVRMWLDSIVKSCRFIEMDIRETGARQTAIIQNAYFHFSQKAVTTALVQQKGGIRFNHFIPSLDKMKASLALSEQMKLITKPVSLDNMIDFKLMQAAIR